VYKSSSKRKVHILKNHPGAALPPSFRDKSVAGSEDATNATFSATVGSVTSQPHACPHCHKQYASNAKLLQHLRNQHQDLAAASGSGKAVSVQIFFFYLVCLLFSSNTHM
jgi:hypothetical protein